MLHERGICKFLKRNNNQQQQLFVWDGGAGFPAKESLSVNLHEITILVLNDKLTTETSIEN